MSASSPRRSLWPLVSYALLAVVAVSRSDSSQFEARLRKRRGALTSGSAKVEDDQGEVRENRASEHGRGRRAATPWEIPWAGWKDVLWRTYQQIGEDRLLAVAAGVVFYGLLALFPTITAFVSLYGLFANASTISDHISIVAGILPSGLLDIFKEQVGRIVATGDTKLGFAFVFGLGLALWSANAGMKAIIDALNVVYEEEEKRGFVKLNLVSLAFTAGAILVLLLAVGAVVVLPLVLAGIGFVGLGEILLRVVRWPLLLGVVLVGLAVLYRYGPSRNQARWQWLTPGSLVAAVAWLAGSGVLSWYLANFADYDATYGSLGAAIGMMMWMWMSSIVILFGGELNSEIEHQTARDSTVGPKKPLGVRGAVMADEVGAAQS